MLNQALSMGNLEKDILEERKRVAKEKKEKVVVEKLDTTPKEMPVPKIPPRRENTFKYLKFIDVMKVDSGVEINYMMNFNDLLSRLDDFNFLEKYRRSLLFSFNYKRNFIFEIVGN